MIIMVVIVTMLKLTSRLTVVPLALWLCTAATAVGRNVDIIIIIIINTRPKPAYGRQGLAGSWGQVTDKVSNFWVFLTSHFAQLGNKPTWDHS